MQCTVRTYAMRRKTVCERESAHRAAGNDMYGEVWHALVKSMKNNEYGTTLRTEALRQQFYIERTIQ